MRSTCGALNMWKDDRKGIIIRNIIFAILFLAIVVGMFFAYRYVQQINEVQDQELVEAYSQQQKEQAAAKQQELQDIEAEYQKDLDTLQQYMPGIVCWGDSITSGSSGNVSYPSILQKYINAYICNIYDFRSSITNASDYSRLDWSNYKVSIPVVNMGGGDENSRTVLGRAGVSPFVVSSDFTIPMAAGEAVPISFTDPNGKDVMPLVGGDAGMNNVIINGVEGVLTLDPESYRQYSTNKYYFSRVMAGPEVAVAKDTPIVSGASGLYEDYIHVICIGTYGGYDSVTELVEQVKAMVARQTKNSDRYIVLGLCSTDKYGYISYDLDSADTALLQAFGNHYINVRKYLCSDVLTDSDVNISWSSEDKSDAKKGVVPKSLRSSTSDSELNSTAYEIIGRLVYERMDSLGYFDEIREELYITETIKQLIKDDPSYLEKMLSNTLKGLV